MAGAECVRLDQASVLFVDAGLALRATRSLALRRRASVSEVNWVDAGEGTVAARPQERVRPGTRRLGPDP